MNKPEKHIRQPRKRDQFKRERNIQSRQVCFLIAVLNLVGTIKLKRPFKLRTQSLPFIKVMTITINDKEYDIQKMTNERVEVRTKQDEESDIAKNTIMRRQEQYQVIEHIHALYEVLEETRFEFETTIEKRDYNAERKALKSVTVDGIYYDENTIQLIGEEIHAILTKLMFTISLEDCKQIDHGDTELMNALLSPFE